MIEAVAAAAMAMSGWEVVAVFLAIAYLVLAIRQNSFCWPVAIASCLIYIVLMYQAGLYMESVLQCFYIAMAVYGWFQWGRGSAAGGELFVTSWPPVAHVFPVSVIALLTFLSGWLLSHYSDAALPYTDSFTTWAAVVTTWMVARKVLQNWHYWFIIDSVSIYLYISRGLWLTAGLFLLYLMLIVVGYRTWRASLRAAA